MRRLFALISAIALIATGCGNSDNAADTKKTRTVTIAGAKIAVPQTPKRIVVLWQPTLAAVTELGFRPVGATGDATANHGLAPYLPADYQTKSLTIVSNSSAPDDINLEKVSSLRPDLIIGVATGNKQYFATMNTLYWDSYNFLANMQVGLVYRDHRGNDGSFWSRGNGWVIAGIARVLKYLPQDDPKRMDFINTFKKMSTVLLMNQGADGLWRSNLLNANQYPNPETSGTGFFTFAFAWGVNNGILDKATYQPSAQKGWDGLVKNVDAAGKLGYVQAVGGAPGPATAGSSLPYAIGAFLLAGGEVAKF